MADVINDRGTQFMGDSMSYQPATFNKNGDLVSQPPLPNGNTSTSDIQNDSRTDQDYKQDLIQAQLQTSKQTEDDDNYYVDPDSSYKMKKVQTSMKDQIKTFVTQYLIGLNTHDGDAYAAGIEGGQAVQNTLDIADRQSQFHSLIASGHNPIDVEKWSMTNDPKDLIANKGKNVRYGNVIYNDVTGKVVSTLPMTIEDQFKRDQLTATQQHNAVLENISQQNADTATSNAQLGQDRFNWEHAGKPIGSGDDGTDSENGTPVDSAHMVIIDPDGRKWNVATNSRGTPQIDKKTGQATVYDPKTGETASRIYNTTYVQQSGQIAQNGAYAINELRHSGNNAYSGGGWAAEGERSTYRREEARDLQNHIDAINASARAFFTNKLIQEGVTPTEELVKEEAGQAGFLDINNTPERNAQIMDHFRGVFNTGINAARRNQTHTSMDENDSSTAQLNPVTESAANKAKQQFSINPGYKDPDTGMTYIGGDPHKKSSWK